MYFYKVSFLKINRLFISILATRVYCDVYLWRVIVFISFSLFAYCVSLYLLFVFAWCIGVNGYHTLGGWAEGAKKCRRRRRRQRGAEGVEGSEMGRGYPLPRQLRGLGSIVSSLSGVRGAAPAKIEFCTIWMQKKPFGGTYELNFLPYSDIKIMQLCVA